MLSKQVHDWQHKGKPLIADRKNLILKRKTILILTACFMVVLSGCSRGSSSSSRAELCPRPAFYDMVRTVTVIGYCDVSEARGAVAALEGSLIRAYNVIDSSTIQGRGSDIISSARQSGVDAVILYQCQNQELYLRMTETRMARVLASETSQGLRFHPREQARYDYTVDSFSRDIGTCLHRDTSGWSGK